MSACHQRKVDARARARAREGGWSVLTAGSTGVEIEGVLPHEK